MGVVLKTKTNLYFYRMWNGISYFQNYYSTPTPLFHDIISIRKALKFCPSRKTPNGMVTVLNKHTTSIFRQPPEDANSIFL